MKIVNPHLLGWLITPWDGLGDIYPYPEDMEDFDPDSEQIMKRLTRRLITPRYLNSSEKAKEKVKNSLRYYLNIPQFNFESLLDSHLLPFCVNEDSRKILVWIWEELFPGESLETDISQFQEIINRHESNGLR